MNMTGRVYSIVELLHKYNQFSSNDSADVSISTE